MMNQEQPQPKKESTSSVILKVILILISVLLVLAIGTWPGRTFAGDSLLEGPESYSLHRHPTFHILRRTFMTIFAVDRAQNIQPMV